MTTDSPSAALDAAAERIGALAPAEQLAAMNRVLSRQPALRTPLSAVLSGITSGESLVATMARASDPTARSLALIVLADVDPAAAATLFDAIDARFKAEMATCVAACLAALPAPSLASLAKLRKVEPDAGPDAVARLAASYDTAMYQWVYQETTKLPDGPAIFALLQPPPEVSTPAWLVGAGLREDVKARAQGAGEFLASVRANQVPWPAATWFAARPELSSTAGRIEVLTAVLAEPGGRDMDRLIDWLIKQLADAKDKGIDPLLARIVREQPGLERGIAAASALAGRKGPIAREALVARIAASDVREPGERDLRYASLAARGLVTMDATDVEPLARYVTPEAVSAPLGRAVARAALGGVASLPAKKLAAVLPIWSKLAVPLLRGPADDLAREVLNHVPEAELSALLPPPARPARGPVASASQARWLARYEAGEHEAVWSEMRAAGVAVFEIEDAARVAAATMQRVKQDLARVVGILRADGYPFAEEPLPGPTKAVAKDLAAIEKAVGAPLPLAFRAFHEIVGPVDLRRAKGTLAETSFNYLAAFDPLQIAPSAVSRDFVATAVKASKRRWVEALRLPVTVMIAMSPARKAEPDSEEDGPYELEAFGHGADGVVRLGGREIAPFVDYLRVTLADGGFGLLQRHERGPALRDLLTAGRVLF